MLQFQEQALEPFTFHAHVPTTTEHKTALQQDSTKHQAMEAVSLTHQASAWQAESGDRPRARVGIRIARNAISNQLVLLLRGLAGHREQIETLAITKSREFEENRGWYEQVLAGHRLVFYSDREFDLLGRFDAVIVPESNHDIYGEFPEDVIKIGMPHGVDIPLRKTVIDYGGGYCFDYVLGIMQQAGHDQCSFEGLFPRALRNHVRNHVCEIPFGFPKLDEFLHEVTRQEARRPRAIAYHLSSLNLENPGSLKLIEPTLKRLLDEFPDHRIVFRPIMSDRNHPIVSACRELGSSYENFHFSDTESYIPDYAAATAMVCHRPYKLHLFGLATGRPTILCHPESEPAASDDPTFVVCPESRLIDSLRSHIDHARPVIPLSERMDRCRQAGVYNPGASITHLARGLDDILQEKMRPEWHCHRLDPETRQDIGLRTHMALQLACARPANMTFLAFAAKNPENDEVLLLIADSYARADFMPSYFYPIGLHYFHALTTRKALSAALKARMLRWWEHRGRHILDDLSQAAESNGVALPDDLLALRGLQSGADDPALGGAKEDPAFVKFETLVDLRTAEPVRHAGPLMLYGAKQLARDFTAYPHSANGDIRAIADPDPKAQGRNLAGRIVQAPDALLESDTPVLICSYDYLPDAFRDLHRSLGPDRAVYAICKDRLIADLLPLVAAFQRPGGD